MKKSITSCLSFCVACCLPFEHLWIADLMMLQNVTWRMIEVINKITWNLCGGSSAARKSGMRKARIVYLSCASATCTRSPTRCCESRPPSTRSRTLSWWWKSCGSVEYSWSRVGHRLCSSDAGWRSSRKDVSLRKGEIKIIGWNAVLNVSWILNGLHLSST